MLKKLERLVDVLLGNEVLFTIDLAFVDALDQFGDDLCQLIRDALADENERELSLWKQDALNELAEMQKEDVDGHEDQQFVLFVLRGLQKLAQYFIAFAGKYHHHSFIRGHVRLQDEVCDFDFDFFGSDLMNHQRMLLVEIIGIS